MSLDISLLETLFCDDRSEFIDRLYGYISSQYSSNFTVWKVNGSICEPTAGKHRELIGRFDLFDLGYEGSLLSNKQSTIEFFGEEIDIVSSLFLAKEGRVFYALTFHEDIGGNALKNLHDIAPYLGKRAEEIINRDSNVNVYVDYQKKIDFVKEGSRILKAIELDEVIAMSLNFFMDVFAAEATCCIHGENFIGYGIEYDDLVNDIKINGRSASDFSETQKVTKFFEEGCESEKYNIHNMFFVYEEKQNLKFFLFNIHFDIVPDKEFSELVSSIVTIAVENSINHEVMTQFKVEESEMKNTYDILSRFMNKELHVEGTPSIYGVNYPAKAAGGDYLAVFKMGDKIFFCVADVCGKGYSAAVFTVALSVFCEMTSRIGLSNVKLDELVGMVNDFLIAKQFEDRFITSFFGIYHCDSKILDYVSCGHEPGLKYSEGKISELKSEFMPLGIMSEDYETASVKLDTGDSLFIYTDGIIEYMEEEELIKRFSELMVDGGNPAKVLYSELVTDKDAQKDDFTCAYFKF